MPGIAVDVRLATEAELEAVTALLVAQLREHRVQTPEAKIASAIQGLLRHPERGRILVAVGEGRPVGVAALSFARPLEYADRSAWLEELYVEPAARGRGIGTRLLRAALRVAAEAGATVVDLEVEADHQRAARLYAREGFRSLARTHWVRTLEPARLAPPRRRPPAPPGRGPRRARRRAVRLPAPRRLRAARGATPASGAGVQLLDHPAQHGIHGGRLVRPARVDELLRVVVHLDAARRADHRRHGPYSSATLSRPWRNVRAIHTSSFRNLSMRGR